MSERSPLRLPNGSLLSFSPVLLFLARSPAFRRALARLEAISVSAAKRRSFAVPVKRAARGKTGKNQDFEDNFFFLLLLLPFGGFTDTFVAWRQKA